MSASAHDGGYLGEGARIKAPRGWSSCGEAVPLPTRLGCLGERRELPQRVRGGAPAANAFYRHISRLLVETMHIYGIVKCKKNY